MLTEREREILAYAASGRGNKDIADQLCVSLDTVKTHLHHIYRKLGVAGRVEAVLAYLNSK
jgi:ATP/maltotriose-dependent transcriptional regulator MalT